MRNGCQQQTRRFHPEIRGLAKQLGKDRSLALSLFETGMSEAMILAALIDIADQVTEEQMDAWVKSFNSWDICDQVCMNLFDKTSLAWKKVREWAKSEEEHVKRAAYSLVACLAWHNKEANDDDFIKLIPVIMDGAADMRNPVKKAVSWALRNIGKRNPRLNKVALETANQLREMDFKPARWIASDAIRDLTSDATKRRLSRD